MKPSIAAVLAPSGRLFLAGLIASLSLAAEPASAMLPSLCNVYKHWSLVAEIKRLRSEEREAEALVHRVDLDVTGDGLPEVFLSSPQLDPAASTLTMHVYSPLSADYGHVYLGTVVLDELQMPDEGSGLVVVRRGASPGELTREAFEFSSEELRSLGPPEPAPAEAIDQARAWREAHQVTIWQATLGAVRGHAEDNEPMEWEPMEWKARSGDGTRAGADMPLDTLVRRDIGGRKSAARPTCLLE